MSLKQILYLKIIFIAALTFTLGLLTLNKIFGVEISMGSIIIAVAIFLVPACLASYAAYLRKELESAKINESRALQSLASLQKQNEELISRLNQQDTELGNYVRELSQTKEELNRLTNLTLARELKMAELKKQLESLQGS